MAYRNTQYEEEKIKQLAASCPKLRISIEKPDKYILTGCPEDNDAPTIKIGAWGNHGRDPAVYRAEYFRLDAVGMLPAKTKGAGRG